jgi:hypothetical protein
MSLFTRLFDAVRSWRRRRGGPRTPIRASVTMEHLDHRQLLSVNFTGNVPIDFPATQSPGVVVLPDNPNVIHPVIAPIIANLVHVSGFDISGIRATYTASDDTLSIGIDQPASGNPGQGEVIAGDADDNGNDGTVNPSVSALEPGFQDFADFGGSEYMEVFLDLTGSGQPDIVAGYAQNDPRSPKQYQVAQAVVNPNDPTGPPGFNPNVTFPNNTGNVYKVNSPVHPNLEFSITHFSQLYLQETGKALTPGAVIGMGAAAGSAQDLGISEAFFPEQTFTVAAATLPTPTPTPCPPASPPVLINPHENRHINTAHPTTIRVNIFGTSGFDVTKIIPSTVALGGAHPIFNFTRYINKDEFLDETFVFKGTDVHLPAGPSEATVTGTLTDGTTFQTSALVFNRDDSFYPASEVAKAQARQAAFPNKISIPISVLQERVNRINGAASAAPNLTAPSPNVPSSLLTATGGSTLAAAVTPATGPVVKIPRREPVVASPRTSTSKISGKLQNSMNQYLQATSAGAAGGGAK